MLLKAYALLPHDFQTLAIMTANAANGCPYILIPAELNLTAVRIEILWSASSIFRNPFKV